MSNNPEKDDYKRLMDQKRFFGEVEQGLQIANREIIHSRIPTLNKESVLSFAVVVARMRATYLEAAFQISTTDHALEPAQESVQNLRNAREMYEEAKAAFEALRYAIERGYVDVDLS